MSERVVKISDYRKEPPIENMIPLIEIVLYENGDTTLWMEGIEYFETNDQFNWAVARIADAVSSLLDEKRRVAGKR